jgi:ketosteroid isomerase-like protein
MKNKVLNGVLLSLLLSLIIACNTKNAEPVVVTVDKEQIKKEIQAKENGFAEVYNAREMKNIGYYADDATSFSQNREPLVGKQAIIDYLKANIDSVPVSNKISFETREVFVSNDGNLVVEIGYFKLFDSTDNSTINSGNYMSLFEKRNGKYVCLRDMSVSDIPLE